MIARLPTQEEWEGWLALPETQALQELARRRRATLKDAWENGNIVGEPANAMSIGACKALQLLEDLDFETVVIGELGDKDG